MTAPLPLLDAEAREAFTDNLAENFCVSAGAGAGKTTAIVRRIANLALRRHQQPSVLSRLVVVTYAKLAAEELRVRTRDLVLQKLEPSAAGRQTLLAELRGAFFGTIHSFCLKLIRDQGRFLGLPERLELLEDNRVDSLWERFCESDGLLKLELPPALLERVGRHLTFDELLDLARAFGPDEATASTGFDADALPPTLDFTEALEDDGGRSKEHTRKHQAHLRRWLGDFHAGAAYVQLPEYKTGSKTFLAAMDRALTPYAAWLNAGAGCLAAHIARAFQAYRLDQGLMTYRDQVYWCRQLFAQPAVLARLRQREYIVILDEAQDTDADMFSILTELTRPADAPLGGWPGTEDAGDAGDAGDAPPPLPGRFSFVGDDQQSIYSDRADLRVYRRYIDAYKAGHGGRHLEFSVTMRCPERVIDAVNGVFADGRLPQDFVEFRALQPRPDCPVGEAWVLPLEGLPEADDGGKAPGVDARFLRECEQVADLVASRGLAGLGIAGWSEVAVLAPRVAWLEAAARVFGSRGLPTCLLSQRSIARDSPRHSWPAALLHVLIHPWDRFELIGVLRDIFSVSDVDMALLHRHAGAHGCPGLSFWPQPPRAEPSAKLKVPSARLGRALKLLHELRRALPVDSPAKGAVPEGLEVTTDCGTLSRYVNHVLRRTALGARLAAIGEPDSALDGFRARALRAECGGVTLRAWVRALVAALGNAVPSEPDSLDAVQFLTCQKAKGLEWPVVIPVGLRRDIRTRAEQFPRVEEQEGLAVIHFSKLTVDPERKTVRARRAAEEFQRMLYVTLTRARRLLILPDGSELYENRAPNFQGLARWEELDVPALLSPAPTPDEPATSTMAGRATPDRAPGPAWFEDDPILLARAAEKSRRIPRRILPSGLVHHGRGHGGADEDDDEDPRADVAATLPATAPEQADDRLLSTEAASLAGGGAVDEPLAGIGGIDYGNWWHDVLQHYPWAASHPGAREAYVREQLDLIDGAARWSQRANAEFARLADSEAHAEFLRYGRVFLSEMPFSHPRTADEWVEGIMDLVIVSREGDELWIVDWKTDRSLRSDKSAAAFLNRIAEKYGPQLREYAQVFSAGFGRTVARLLLYSTEVGRVVEVPR